MIMQTCTSALLLHRFPNQMVCFSDLDLIGEVKVMGSWLPWISWTGCLFSCQVSQLWNAFLNETKTATLPFLSVFIFVSLFLHCRWTQRERDYKHKLMGRWITTWLASLFAKSWNRKGNYWISSYCIRKWSWKCNQTQTAIKACRLTHDLQSTKREREREERRKRGESA